MSAEAVARTAPARRADDDDLVAGLVRTPTSCPAVDGSSVRQLAGSSSRVTSSVSTSSSSLTTELLPPMMVLSNETV